MKNVGQRSDQWLGNLFYRGCQPRDLIDMPYHVLAYWAEWHEVIERAEEKAMKESKRRA